MTEVIARRQFSLAHPFPVHFCRLQSILGAAVDVHELRLYQFHLDLAVAEQGQAFIRVVAAEIPIKVKSGKHYTVHSTLNGFVKKRGFKVLMQNWGLSILCWAAQTAAQQMLIQC